MCVCVCVCVCVCYDDLSLSLQLNGRIKLLEGDLEASEDRIDELTS